MLNKSKQARDGGVAADRIARRQKRFDIASKIGFIFCAGFSIFAIAAIILFLLVSSIPGIAEVGLFKFLFGTHWAPLNENLPVEERYGILPMIVGTLYVTALSVVIGGVIGVLTAIFIARFCPKKIKPVIKQAMNLLAGLPSVIYGFFGLVVLVPFVRDTAMKWGGGQRERQRFRRARIGAGALGHDTAHHHHPFGQRHRGAAAELL